MEMLTSLCSLYIMHVSNYLTVFHNYIQLCVDGNFLNVINVPSSEFQCIILIILILS